MVEGSDRKRILLVTARHDILTLNKDDNRKFAHKVTVSAATTSSSLATRRSKSTSSSLRLRSAERRSLPSTWKSMLRRGKNKAAEKERKQAQASLKEAMEDLNTFYRNVMAYWATLESHVLGHVIFSPPINVGLDIEQYTEDFAIIAIDTSKID
jgi:hypothetical protein